MSENKQSETLLAEIEEAGSLAMELAHAYREMTAFYHEQMEMSVLDATTQARGRDFSPEDAAEDTARILARPPDQVSWFELNRLADRDPEQVIAVWSKIKAEARNELASGHRAAQALDWEGRPWDRARFLAIRQSFHASTPPQNGIESALLDTAAEAYSDHLQWSERLHMQVSCEVETERDALKRNGGWTPPRLGMADAIEQSSRMAERAYKRFLQTVKMLQELRRSSPTLYVSHAGQINVGHQQVNLSNTSPPSSTLDDAHAEAALPPDDFDKTTGEG